MGFLQIHSYRSLNRNLDRIATALERIADTAEGHLRRKVFVNEGNKDDAELMQQTDEDFAELERLELQLQHSRGLAPDVEEDLASMLQAAKDGRD